MSDDPISFDHLSSLDPKKLEIIKFVISSCHGKPLELILPDLMAASSRLFRTRSFFYKRRNFHDHRWSERIHVSRRTAADRYDPSTDHVI